ncbi:MAG: sporulation integral membrane protein YtvI [Clostridia bacterium]|nr:sporulation integral membrane protein YtvI [Clostridia bacterium]
MDQQAKKRFLINFLYIAVIGGAAVILSRFLLLKMFPFLLSVIVATLSQRPAAFLSKKSGIKKPFCAVLLSAGIYIGVGAGLIFLVYRLIISSAGLIDYLPQIFSNLKGAIQNIEGWLSSYFPQDYKLSLSGVLEGFAKSLTDFLTDAIKKAVTYLPSFLLSSVVALVAACYISKDFEGLSKFAKSLCSEDFYNRFNRIKNILTKSVLKIIKGYLILMLITFVELWLGLSILSVKNAYLWAFFIALIDFLPVLGTGAVMVPWAVYCAVTGSTGLAIGLAVLYIIIVIIRNFCEPKIVSQQMGINPLFILFSMYLGLKLFGGAGLIILPIILIVTIKYYKEEMQ